MSLTHAAKQIINDHLRHNSTDAPEWHVRERRRLAELAAEQAARQQTDEKNQSRKNG